MMFPLYQAIRDLLSGTVDALDASSAKASFDADRVWIMAEIEEKIGVEAFNLQLRRPLKTRILEMLLLRSLRVCTCNCSCTGIGRDLMICRHWIPTRRNPLIPTFPVGICDLLPHCTLQAKEVETMRLCISLGAVFTGEKLDIGFWGIGSECFVVLCQALTSSPLLVELITTGNDIGDEGLEALSHFLKQPTCNLSGLELGSNNIGDKGATCLADALKNNQSVHGICLDKNNIGVAGGEAFVEAFKVPGSGLRSFYCKWNPEIPEGLKDDMLTAWQGVRGPESSIAVWDDR